MEKELKKLIHEYETRYQRLKLIESQMKASNDFLDELNRDLKTLRISLTLWQTVIQDLKRIADKSVKS